MEIKARRCVALVYTCPKCGATQGSLDVTPTKRRLAYRPECFGYKCGHCEMEVVEQKYYTLFAADLYTKAGTLAKIGPFKVCDVVFSNIRAFRKWVAKREAEQAEQLRVYMEKLKVQQAETEARLKREREQQALLKEAAAVAYRREHAAELIAEQVARDAWPVDEPKPAARVEPFDTWLDDELEDHPF